MTGPKFLRLHVLQAGYGDCLVVEYGDDTDAQHLIVIDGGVAGETTPTLKTLLKGWPNALIHLLVVSHVDDDHIVGAIRLLKDRNLRGRIEDIWFNGATRRQDLGLEGLGFNKGDKLEEMLSEKSLGLPWNKAFGGADIAVDSNKPNRPVKLPFGATITLLSPTVEALRDLRKAWASDSLEPREANVEPEELQQFVPAGLEALGGGSAAPIDIAAILQTTSDKDESVTNGSSIAFLFDFGGASVLLAADAHASVLLETSANLDGGRPRAVEILKLPHHGSARNVTVDLLKAFPASTYVVSADGKKNGHPDDLAIARIVDVAPGSEVHFNYPGLAYKRWLEYSVDNPEQVTVSTTISNILTIKVPLPT